MEIFAPNDRLLRAIQLRRRVRRLNLRMLIELREYVAAEAFLRVAGEGRFASSALGPLEAAHQALFEPEQGLLQDTHQQLLAQAARGWASLRLPTPQSLRPAKAVHPARPSPRVRFAPDHA